jgi:hypothetical protein
MPKKTIDEIEKARECARMAAESCTPEERAELKRRADDPCEGIPLEEMHWLIPELAASEITSGSR